MRGSTANARGRNRRFSAPCRAEMPSTAFRSSMPARGYGLGRAEMLEQRAPARGADAGDLVERIGADGLAALGPVRADGEAVRLVAQPLHEIEHRVARLEHDRALAAGKWKCSRPASRSGPLATPIEGDVVQAEVAPAPRARRRAGRGRRRSARGRAGRETRRSSGDIFGSSAAGGRGPAPPDCSPSP